MRIGFIIILIFTVLTAATAQKTELDYINSDKFEPDGQFKGIGVVEINLGRESFDKELVIYDSIGEPKIIIKATLDDVATQVGEQSFSGHDNTNPFNPRLFITNPDYFRLILDCTNSTDEYYQVIVDQKTDETGFIKKRDKSFKFETVSEYVSEWTTSGLDFDRSQNPLRKEPSDNGTIITNEDQKKYKIWSAEKIEMKGDWIKVKIRDTEEGWIRWRQGDKIVIRIYFAC